MHYRPYRPTDFAALYAIEEECFQPPFRFPRAYMRELLADESSVTWMAEEDERLAGFAIVEFAAEPEGTYGYVQTIEVASAFRRRGVASELLYRIEDSAREARAFAIWLHVDSENQAAIALYRGHGYVQQGTQDHYYARGRAADIYRKILASVAAEDAP